LKTRCLSLKGSERLTGKEICSSHRKGAVLEKSSAGVAHWNSDLMISATNGMFSTNVFFFAGGAK